jgi:hypothetical protein
MQKECIRSSRPLWPSVVVFSVGLTSLIWMGSTSSSVILVGVSALIVVWGFHLLRSVIREHKGLQEPSGADYVRLLISHAEDLAQENRYLHRARIVQHLDHLEDVREYHALILPQSLADRIAKLRETVGRVV